MRFFAGGADDDGRTFDEILGWDDARLEMVHDYIQWIFPLPERSGANPWAPVLDAATIAAIRGRCGDAGAATCGVSADAGVLWICAGGRCGGGGAAIRGGVAELAACGEP